MSFKIGNKVNLGRKFSEIHKKRIGVSRIGIKPWNKGRATSEITRKKISEVCKKQGHFIPPLYGERNPMWKGGISTVNVKIRNSPEYKLWRISVFQRDKFTCIWCGEKGGKLNADHIKPFADFPELRFAIDNGRTLCEVCHSKTDTYKGRGRGKK